LALGLVAAVLLWKGKGPQDAQQDRPADDNVAVVDRIETADSDATAAEREETQNETEDAAEQPQPESERGPVKLTADYVNTQVPPLFGLSAHTTEHYIIYSQLSEEGTYDIARRLEVLYDYYAQRFSNVYYPINFPKVVCLFNNKEDYIAAGGHPTMPGLFMGGGDEHGARLMMRFDEGNIGAFLSSCPLMYHEAFHQFVAVEISQAGNVNRQWPTWLDEGQSTFFNNISWTGDGWLEGNARFEMVASAIQHRPSFIPLTDLLNIDGAGWHQLLAEHKVWACYMESWMLIHFLHYAEDGKYRPLFDTYVEQTSTGQDKTETTKQIIALEPKFTAWCDERLNDMNTDMVMTGAKYYELITAIATSHLARAHARGQRFESGADFLAKAQADQLDLPPRGDAQWLPKTLREEMLFFYNQITQSGPITFEVEYDRDGQPGLRVHQPRYALELVGRFELDAIGQVTSVDVEYTQCESLDLAEAKRIVAERKKAGTTPETAPTP
jgi:hypothetical protein